MTKRKAIVCFIFPSRLVYGQKAEFWERIIATYKVMIDLNLNFNPGMRSQEEYYSFCYLRYKNCHRPWSLYILCSKISWLAEVPG